MAVGWGSSVCSSVPWESGDRVSTGGLPRKGKEPRLQQSPGGGMTRKMKDFLKISLEKIENERVTQEKSDFYWQEKGRI